MPEMQGSTRQDFAALNAPVTPETWALEAELANTVEGTGDIPIRFTRPIEILGMRATVVPKLPLAGGGLILPTLDDVNVMLTTDNEDLWTKRVQESGGNGNFVPLGHLVLDGSPGRLLRIVPRGDAPDLAFQFNWAQFVAGTPFYEDAIIRLSLLTRYISKEDRDLWVKAEKVNR